MKYRRHNICNIQVICLRNLLKYTLVGKEKLSQGCPDHNNLYSVLKHSNCTSVNIQIRKSTSTRSSGGIKLSHIWCSYSRVYTESSLLPYKVLCYGENEMYKLKNGKELLSFQWSLLSPFSKFKMFWNLLNAEYWGIWLLHNVG
jgi:hypothetical protein